MTSAAERARIADSNRTAQHELQNRVHDIHSRFLQWADKQPGSSLINIEIPEIDFFGYGHTTSETLMPNEQGERSRWVFTYRKNSFDSRVVIAHFQFWGRNSTERSNPTYTETYWINDYSISPNHPVRDLYASSPEDMDKAEEVFAQMELLMQT